MRLTFSDPSRSAALLLGSVKDNIGHAEGASGAAGVIKSLLMMQHGTIPKQASFMTLNPRIKCSRADKITVPKETQPWVAQRRVALVNNYGAAGSNAAIVLREYVGASNSRQTLDGVHSRPSPASYPILLSAKSPNSLCSYMAVLKSYLPKVGKSLSNVAYNIARKQNSSFEYRTAFTASDPVNLLSRLEDTIAETSSTTTCSKEYPVVLCFGGQTGRNVTLSREVFDGCELLRTYLVGQISTWG